MAKKRLQKKREAARASAAQTAAPKAEPHQKSKLKPTEPVKSGD